MGENIEVKEMVGFNLTGGPSSHPQVFLKECFSLYGFDSSTCNRSGRFLKLESRKKFLKKSGYSSYM